MNISASIGDRHRKNDPREMHSWIGKLDLKATQEGEQFLLAALYKALQGEASKTLTNALRAEAKKCLKEHRKNEERCGVSVVIQ